MIGVTEGRPAAQLPEGDVVRILLEQHTRIQQLFKQLHDATADSKRRVFDDLRQLLAGHEAAEEMIVRPVTRATAGGNRIARARNHEEHMATHMLAELEMMDIQSQDFSTALAKFEAIVVEHAQHEEAEEFPLISATAANNSAPGWAGGFGSRRASHRPTPIPRRRGPRWPSTLSARSLRCSTTHAM